MQNCTNNLINFMIVPCATLYFDAEKRTNAIQLEYFRILSEFGKSNFPLNNVILADSWTNMQIYIRFSYNRWSPAILWLCILYIFTGIGVVLWPSNWIECKFWRKCDYFEPHSPDLNRLANNFDDLFIQFLLTGKIWVRFEKCRKVKKITKIRFNQRKRSQNDKTNFKIQNISKLSR